MNIIKLLKVFYFLSQQAVPSYYLMVAESFNISLISAFIHARFRQLYA